jgi:hypothetical protein
MASIISAGTTSGTALNMAGDTSGVLQLATNGSTTAVTINTSQNVGIGTTSPSYKLDVQGSVGSTISSKTAEFNAAGGSIYSSYNDGTKTWRVGAGIETAGMFTIRNQTDAILPLHIESGGRVGINGIPVSTGDTSQKLQAISSGIYVESYTYTGGRSQFWTAGAEGTGANSYHVFSASNTGVYIAYGATSWTGFSDTRLKNITGTYTNALDGLMQLEPIKFTWKSDDTNKPCVGVSAQSVENVVPEAVDKNKIAGSNDDTEYLAIRYTELIPIMIASIQEQQTIINDLKARITALEGAA